MPTDEREAFVHERIDAADTVLFGSTNGTTPGVVYMRWGRRTYANVRPVRWRPGFRSPLARPEGIDYLIVRENLEDAYIGVMGDVDDLHSSGLVGPKARLAYAGRGPLRGQGHHPGRSGEGGPLLLRAGPAPQGRGLTGKLTVSAKTNMLPKTDRYFCDIVREVAQDYPDVAYEQFIVDDMAHRLVVHPHDLDVLLLPNLYGDVLSDEGAATSAGSAWPPRAATATTSPTSSRPTAPPPTSPASTASTPPPRCSSAVMLLDHLGLGAAARQLDAAIAAVYAEGRTLTADQGGTASTEEFAERRATAVTL